MVYISFFFFGDNQARKDTHGFMHIQEHFCHDDESEQRSSRAGEENEVAIHSCKSKFHLQDQGRQRNWY